MDVNDGCRDFFERILTDFGQGGRKFEIRFTKYGTCFINAENRVFICRARNRRGKTQLAACFIRYHIEAVFTTHIDEFRVISVRGNYDPILSTWYCVYDVFIVVRPAYHMIIGASFNSGCVQIHIDGVRKIELRGETKISPAIP